VKGDQDQGSTFCAMRSAWWHPGQPRERLMRRCTHQTTHLLRWWWWIGACSKRGWPRITGFLFPTLPALRNFGSEDSQMDANKQLSARFVWFARHSDEYDSDAERSSRRRPRWTFPTPTLAGDSPRRISPRRFYLCSLMMVREWVL